MKSPLRIPRLLVTNDDGFDAPGLAVLAEAAQDFADEIWIVAPEHDQSGTGQSLSLHTPLRAWPRGDRRWAVAGTPGDCVGLAIGELMGGQKPSLILSGVNAGTNIGDEVSLSGTLGASFTGLLLGVPSIALSQACGTRQSVKWETARVIVPKMLNHFLTHGWRKDTCLSINIPDREAKEITGFSWAKQSQKNLTDIQIEKRDDKRAQPYYWLTLVKKVPPPDHQSDHAILERGEVAVTLLGHGRSLESMEPSVIFDEALAEADEV